MITKPNKIINNNSQSVSGRGSKNETAKRSKQEKKALAALDKKVAQSFFCASNQQSAQALVQKTAAQAYNSSGLPEILALYNMGRGMGLMGNAKDQLIGGLADALSVATTIISNNLLSETDKRLRRQELIDNGRMRTALTDAIQGKVRQYCTANKIPITRSLFSIGCTLGSLNVTNQGFNVGSNVPVFGVDVDVNVKEIHSTVKDAIKSLKKSRKKTQEKKLQKQEQKNNNSMAGTFDNESVTPYERENTPNRGPFFNAYQSGVTPNGGDLFNGRQSAVTPNGGPFFNAYQSGVTPNGGDLFNGRQSAVTPNRGPFFNAYQSGVMPNGGPFFNAYQSGVTPNGDDSFNAHQSRVMPPNRGDLQYDNRGPYDNNINFPQPIFNDDIINPGQHREQSSPQQEIRYFLELIDQVIEDAPSALISDVVNANDNDFFPLLSTSFEVMKKLIELRYKLASPTTEEDYRQQTYSLSCIDFLESCSDDMLELLAHAKAYTVFREALLLHALQLRDSVIKNPAMKLDVETGKLASASAHFQNEDHSFVTLYLINSAEMPTIIKLSPEGQAIEEENFSIDVRDNNGAAYLRIGPPELGIAIDIPHSEAAKDITLKLLRDCRDYAVSLEDINDKSNFKYIKMLKNRINSFSKLQKNKYH